MKTAILYTKNNDKYTIVGEGKVKNEEYIVDVVEELMNDIEADIEYEIIDEDEDTYDVLVWEVA